MDGDLMCLPLEEYDLEAGLYCSFARQSVIATMAAATGIDTRALLELALRNVLVDQFPLAD